MKKNFLAAIILMSGSPVVAEVTSVSDSGFALAYEETVAASAEEIYSAMTRIGEWWDPDHSWEGNPDHLYMDMKIGGCFCEKLSNGGGVEHLRLVYFAPGKEIRLTGGLGPLQGMGLGGAMVWTITPADDGNTVSWKYTTHGHAPEGTIKGLAPIVNSVQQQAFDRLIRFISTGTPEKKPG